jgi:hypothetical protein
MVEVSAINFDIQGSIPGNSRLSPLEKVLYLRPEASLGDLHFRD